MNFEPKIIFEINDEAITNFSELKCNLIDFNQKYNFVVNKNYFPENVVYMNCHNYKEQFSIEMFFDVGHGEDFEYEVKIEIDKGNGKIKIEFNSYLWENTHQKNDEYIPVELDIPEICDIVKFCFPSVESFLNKLPKIKNNYPCLDNCIYNDDKIKNGSCDKFYTLK